MLRPQAGGTAARHRRRPRPRPRPPRRPAPPPSWARRPTRPTAPSLRYLDDARAAANGGTPRGCVRRPPARLGPAGMVNGCAADPLTVAVGHEVAGRASLAAGAAKGPTGARWERRYSIG